VWAAGFIMAAITYMDRYLMAVVPPDTQVVKVVEGKADPIGGGQRVNLDGRKVLYSAQRDLSDEEPQLHMSRNKNLGVLYAAVLLLIIVVSNVPLRGLWSLVVILFIVLMIVIFALADIWTWLLDK